MTVVEIAVNVVTSTHVYQFCGRYFLQKQGGPIGLTSTASLAGLIMKIWDMAWLTLMEREKLEILLFFRYVDDVRSFLRPLEEGWRWTGHTFEFSELWMKEDIESGVDDQTRTMGELVKSMNSLVEYIQEKNLRCSRITDSLR